MSSALVKVLDPSEDDRDSLMDALLFDDDELNLDIEELESESYTRAMSQGLPGVSAEQASRTTEHGSRYEAGDIIAGKYRLVEPLSQGGMGSVWVALNVDLDVQVAVKLIRPDLDSSFISQRFVTEARLAARIEHPAIVSVFDLGRTERNDPYIVMELLRGQDLRSLLEQNLRLPATYAVQLLLPIADALATAHAKGIVHRDLKPENVFIAKLDDRLQPKLVDFGIAKAQSSTQRRITRSGAVVGSPDYMSPEQARGLDDVDERADVWAFSIVLYECLTGSTPFAESSYKALLRDILEKDVTPLPECGVADAELWAILERGLAKDREQRYQTMKELGRALAHWLRARWVDEDVCGHSLRATWLRESDLGRGSHSGAENTPAPMDLPTLRPQDVSEATPSRSAQTIPGAVVALSAKSGGRGARYAMGAGALALVSCLGALAYTGHALRAAELAPGLGRMPTPAASSFVRAAPIADVPVAVPAVTLEVSPATQATRSTASRRAFSPWPKTHPSTSKPRPTRVALVDPVFGF